ncbi:MAG: hypothetical protein H7X97_12980, partial [Opitutaceae bacterium]|nr:hypothetical protein [Verrucomicrobiales bacterium]
MSRPIPPQLMRMRIVWMLVVGSTTVFSQETPSASPSSPTTGVTEVAAAKSGDTFNLSYGVADILKLARAKVSDETIIAFIGSSGRIYNLTANEILYLRTQGVADRVLTSMLEQRQKPAEPVGWTTPPSRSSSEPKQPPSTPTVNTQPATPAVQPAPAPVPPQPVYVLRNPPPYYPYYDYYPYDRAYYRY